MDFVIALDSSSSISLQQQIYDALRRAILEGRLRPQQRVPSTRSLAQSLGVSRTTVTQSYERLLSEGYLETVVGAGTFVCAQLPDELLHAHPVMPSQPSSATSIALSSYGQRLVNTTITLQTEPNTTINFRYGRPALEQFPLKLWRKLLSRHCRSDRDWLDYASDFRGYAPLRQAIADYLSRTRAVRCSADQIVLTNGTQQALHLVLQVLLEPGEPLALEDPGYLSARRIFLARGAQLMPIPVDESGLVVSKLNTVNPAPRLVYVTPSHQFPTGAVLSLPRRLELLGWAEQSGALILEDDYDSEYRYGGRSSSQSENRPIPALQGLDTGHSVIYMGTFSKVLFPSLRIGYLVLPPKLVPILAQAKWLSDRQLPCLEQYALTDFITEGHLESHIRKMRTFYDLRRQALVQTLQEQFGDRVTVLGEQAGIHVMVRLHLSATDAEIIERAKQVGVGLMSAQPHYLQPIDRGEFIFGYGELNENQISDGITRLARSFNI